MQYTINYKNPKILRKKVGMIRKKVPYPGSVHLPQRGLVLGQYGTGTCWGIRYGTLFKNLSLKML
jgi:hypothetical protein